MGFPRLAMASIAAMLVLGLPLSQGAFAEEGGSGHYLPGSMASFMDAVPTTPTFILRYNQLYYSGSAGANKAIPIDGHAALGLNATSWGEGITLAWAPKLKMPKHWSYMMSTTIPFVQMDVSASAVVQAPSSGNMVGISRSSSLGSLGDMIIMPAMFNYNFSPNLNMNFRLAEYLPTGDYSTSRLANTGKNFTTTEPTAAIIYMGAKNGREASLFAGIDFNTKNSATQYQSGDQFHLDGTVAQHLPLLKGLAGIGLSSFYYQQVTGDSGSGATFGQFKSTDAGIGPVVSYVKPFGKKQLLAEFKWLDEYYTANRLQGSTVFFKAMFKF